MAENTHKGEGGGITDPAYPAKFIHAVEGALSRWPEPDWKAAHDDQVRRKRVAQAEVKRLRAALREIRDRDWVENALDPQWAGRIADDALNSDGTR